MDLLDCTPKKRERNTLYLYFFHVFLLLVLKNTIFILLQTCFFLRYLNEQDEENSKTNLLIYSDKFVCGWLPLKCQKKRRSIAFNRHFSNC